MIVTRTTHIIKRAEVKANSDILYLFGDNLRRTGLGGQAKEMRYEPNTIGIVTKKYPSNSESSFMTDDEFADNRVRIAEDIQKVKDAWATGKYKSITIPLIGIGLAKLPEKAPSTYQFLIEQLDSLNELK